MQELVKHLAKPLTGDLDFTYSDAIEYVDGNLGIPIHLIKSILQSVFDATNSKVSNSLNIHSSVTDSKLCNSSVTDSRIQSKIILLFIPEHTTALNLFRYATNTENISTSLEFILFLLTKHSSKSCLFQCLYMTFILDFGCFTILRII